MSKKNNHRRLSVQSTVDFSVDAFLQPSDPYMEQSGAVVPLSSGIPGAVPAHANPGYDPTSDTLLSDLSAKRKKKKKYAQNGTEPSKTKVLSKPPKSPFIARASAPDDIVVARNTTEEKGVSRAKRLWRSALSKIKVG